MQYGFIGCGNMGGAIAAALDTPAAGLMLSDRSGKAQDLAHRLGCRYGTVTEVAEQCDRIFLAVKPQNIAQVLTLLQPIICRRKPLLISMAAGISLGDLQRMTADGIPILRIMPNTPVAVGKGIVLYCANAHVRPDVLSSVLRDMAPCGMLDAVEERLFDAAGTLTGCGPAYVYLFLEALADGAVACGVPRQAALSYAAEMVAGAAEMARTSGQHPSALKDAVCSPGGSTIAGIQVLESGAFRGTVMACLRASWEKTAQLGK